MLLRVVICQVAKLSLHENAPASEPGAQGFQARVLFDYEAAEPNEINLVEGEIIHQIEVMDDGQLESSCFLFSG